jgi:inhibitor of cysteine peptidase
MNKLLITVLVLLLVLPLIGSIQQDVYRTGALEINRFSSYWELENFVTTNAQQKTSVWRNDLFNRAIPESAPAPESGEGAKFDISASDYSTTNIQVTGVDEADIVKTDGEYIYLVSGNRTIIVKAYPPAQAQVLSEIELEGTVIGIFINEDRLVVFEEETPYYDYYDVPVKREYEIMPYISPTVHIKVYDRRLRLRGDKRACI